MGLIFRRKIIVAMFFGGVSGCNAGQFGPLPQSEQVIDGRALMVTAAQLRTEVQDLGERPLTEDDRHLARRAAEAHCAASARVLEPSPPIFYPAGAEFVFGRCQL